MNPQIHAHRRMPQLVLRVAATLVATVATLTGMAATSSARQLEPLANQPQVPWCQPGDWETGAANSVTGGKFNGSSVSCKALAYASILQKTQGFNFQSNGKPSVDYKSVRSYVCPESYIDRDTRKSHTTAYCLEYVRLVVKADNAFRTAVSGTVSVPLISPSGCSWAPGDPPPANTCSTAGYASLQVPVGAPATARCTGQAQQLESASITLVCDAQLIPQPTPQTAGIVGNWENDGNGDTFAIAQTGPTTYTGTFIHSNECSNLAGQPQEIDIASQPDGTYTADSVAYLIEPGDDCIANPGDDQPIIITVVDSDHLRACLADASDECTEATRIA